MPEKRSPLVIIREFCSVPGNPVTLAEMKAFTAATTPAERLELARQAAAQMGIEVEVPA